MRKSGIVESDEFETPSSVSGDSGGAIACEEDGVVRILLVDTQQSQRRWIARRKSTRRRRRPTGKRGALVERAYRGEEEVRRSGCHLHEHRIAPCVCLIYSRRERNDRRQRTRTNFRLTGPCSTRAVTYGSTFVFFVSHSKVFEAPIVVDTHGSRFRLGSARRTSS